MTKELPASANEVKKISHLWCLCCWEFGSTIQKGAYLLAPFTLSPEPGCDPRSTSVLKGGLGSSHTWKDRVLRGGALKSGGQTTSPSAFPFSNLQLCCFHWGWQITDTSVALCYAFTIAPGAEDESFPGKSTGSSIMWPLKPTQLRGREVTQVPVPSWGLQKR